MQVRRTAMQFRRIAEAQIDQRRITLRIMAADDGTVLGRVSTLAYGEKGIELMSTVGADPPIDTALALAVRIATFKEEGIDVVDPDRLWRAEWGVLEET